MKNKLIAILTVGFALLFITFVIRITDEMSNSNKNILKSQNVIDVTDEISTHVYITNEDLPLDGSWTKPNFDTQKWQAIKIPSYQIVKMNNFKEGNFAYYRIRLPKKEFIKIKHLQNESYLALQSVYFSRVDIVLNGRFFGTNRPVKSIEAKLNLPVIENEDNVICLKGFIRTGDTGIDHRNKIMLGKGAEFNEVHRASYKAQTVFQLVFILCKGSILFIFALIYLLIKVDSSFEKFFVFGFCAVLEELIAGDYFYGPLNFNQMVYFYNLVNIGAAISVFLFFSQLLNRSYSVKMFKILSIILAASSTALAADALNWNYFVDISMFMKLWNLITVSILIYYVPTVIKFDRILFLGLLATITLYLWGTLPSSNIGLNFKAYGNLLLFFMVAYQTFALFRREQDLLQLKQRQLLEQEKDVVIGKTASLLAHDVRKPLEQMRLVMDKVMSGDADKEFLDIAKKEIDLSLAGVDRQVDDIMNISKSNEFILKEISFYKVLTHSIKQVMSIHQEMDLELEYDFRTGHSILGDEGRLSSAMVNLISNAVEAIRDIGNTFSGKIIFTTYRKNNEFIFKIFNNGPEIPSIVIDNIFKPLFTYGKANGTGLGLASVVKTVNEHKGTIKVHNIQARGVEFTVVFQAGQESESIPVHSFHSSSKRYNYSIVKPIHIERTPKFRVFLLENNSDSVKHYKTILQHLPYETQIEFAKDIKSAEEMITRFRFDLYLLNRRLGGLEFFQTNLSFLSFEVKTYADVSDLLSLNDIKQICKTIYPKRTQLLLVDDTKLFRVAWQSFHGDHNILCVASPEEALQAVTNSEVKIDVCVLDFHFENSSLNGEALARRILEIRKDVGILISSSLDQKLDDFKSISKRDYDARKFLHLFTK